MHFRRNRSIKNFFRCWIVAWLDVVRLGFWSGQTLVPCCSLLQSSVGHRITSTVVSLSIFRLSSCSRAAAWACIRLLFIRASSNCPLSWKCLSFRCMSIPTLVDVSPGGYQKCWDLIVIRADDKWSEHYQNLQTSIHFALFFEGPRVSTFG